MFKSLANKLLQRFLAPYVEGLSEEKLNMRYGHVSLKSVRLKPTLLADLGLDVVDLEEGKLDSVSLDLNSSAAFFSGLNFSLHGLTIAVRPTAQQTTGDQRPDSEILQDMRDNKRSRVESGARELIEAMEKAVGAESEDEASAGAAFITNLLQTLKVQITRISIRLRDYAVDSETVANLDAANLGDPVGKESHSMSFGDGGINSGVLETGVAVQGLGLRVGSKGGPLPLLKPLNLQLQVCRDSTRHSLSLSFQVGGNAKNGKDAGAAVTKAQIGLIAATLGSLTRESERMQSLLVPVGTEELVHLETAEDAERTCAEFEGLEGRRREVESFPSDGRSYLSDTEAWRLQVLWDVVPEPLLTKWVLPMVQAEWEASRRRRAPQGPCRGGILSCCMKEDTQAEVVNAFDNDALEMPSSLSISVSVESFSFDIYDDEARILMITIENSAWELTMNSRLDHKSLPTAAVSFTAEVGYLFAEHKHEPVLTVLYKNQSEEDVGNKSHQHVFVSRFCNSFEKDRTIISLSVESQPWELVLPDTLIPSLIRFVTEASKAVADTGAAQEAWDLVDREAAEATLDSYFTQGEAWLQSDRGQEVLQGAAKRIPEALDIHVTLCGPRVQMHLPGDRAVRVMFGSLVLETPGPCPCQAPRLRVGLRELALEVRDEGMRHDIIESFSFETDFAWRDEGMNIGLRLPYFHISTSPELLQVLIAAPMSIIKHFQVEEPQPQKASAPRLSSKGSPATLGTPNTMAAEQKESAMEKRARRYLEKVQSTASEKAEAEKEQTITVSLDVERVRVSLYDASTPVLRLESRLRAVSLL